SRIMKMKDGRTHLSYKAEHAIDLDSEMIVAATIFHGDLSDPKSLMETLSEAEATLSTTNGATIEELVTDKGYHEGPTLAACEGQGIRTYVPEPKSPRKRRWIDKSEQEQRAVLNNRRRTKRAKSKRLQ
ncbi:MAG: transposase, partial [Planctomycetota bacterium JB042]